MEGFVYRLNWRMEFFASIYFFFFSVLITTTKSTNYNQNISIQRNVIIRNVTLTVTEVIRYEPGANNYTSILTILSLIFGSIYN